MYYDAAIIQDLVVKLVSIGMFGGVSISATCYFVAFIVRKSAAMINSI